MVQKLSLTKTELIKYYYVMNLILTEFDVDATNAFIITSSVTAGPPKGVWLTQTFFH